MISVVIPVYKASNTIEKLVYELDINLSTLNMPFEVILVDDRSPDDSWHKMKQLQKNNSFLKIIRLSRNFGQHPTIFAGLSKAKGEWIVVMDCDLQDQPKEIVKLYHTAVNKNVDIVYAERTQRKDSFFKRMSSKMFYLVFNYFSGMKFNKNVANFGIYNKKVISSILEINDYIKFFPLYIKWVGFKAEYIDIEHNERDSGQSTYSFKSLMNLAFNTIISFSDKPLRLFITFGGIMSIISFLVGLYYLIKALFDKIEEPGFSSLIISIWFLSGLIISCIGLVGVYLGKTFDQTKNRPTFIIDKSYEN
jgi:glycosyltransferase involved in cell wall biosynthesis